jgi:hypothetical protein
MRIYVVHFGGRIFVSRLTNIDKLLLCYLERETLLCSGLMARGLKIQPHPCMRDIHKCFSYAIDDKLTVEEVYATDDITQLFHLPYRLKHMRSCRIL